tara:strand:+ start:36 stop:611 length:576 start_codon:yes stop_codon:yes gene_type:complete
MEGCLITFIGPSGVGKSAILERINLRYPGLISKSISTTTRIKRTDESDLDFHFRSREEFVEMIANDELLEYNNYVGNYYGTRFDDILPLLDEGKIVVKIIEVNGLVSVGNSDKLKGYEHVAIFIDAPSRSEREKRIRDRGDLSDGEIIARMKTGDDELRFYFENKEYFDHYVMNGNLEEAVGEVLGIIRNL